MWSFAEYLSLQRYCEVLKGRRQVSFASSGVLSALHRPGTVRALSHLGLEQHRREKSEPCQEQLAVFELGLWKCKKWCEDGRGLPKYRIIKYDSKDES